MYRLIIANAFSLSMLNREDQLTDPRQPLPIEDPQRFIASSREMCRMEGDCCMIHSIVGHKDTAAVFSAELRIPVAFNRETFELQPEDDLLVGQYVGPRLEEGATSLPFGARIEWWLV